MQYLLHGTVTFSHIGDQSRSNKLLQVFLSFRHTVNFLKFWTPEKFAVITLKFEHGGFTVE